MHSVVFMLKTTAAHMQMNSAKTDCPARTFFAVTLVQCQRLMKQQESVSEDKPSGTGKELLMTVTLRLILLLLALVCFLAAAIRYSPPKVELMALGLAFWALAQLAIP